MARQLKVQETWIHNVLSLQVNFIKTLWGVTEKMGNCPEGYDKLFARIKNEVTHLNNHLSAKV